MKRDEIIVYIIVAYLSIPLVLLMTWVVKFSIATGLWPILLFSFIGAIAIEIAARRK